MVYDTPMPPGYAQPTQGFAQPQMSQEQQYRVLQQQRIQQQELEKQRIHYEQMGQQRAIQQYQQPIQPKSMAQIHSHQSQYIQV